MEEKALEKGGEKAGNFSMKEINGIFTNLESRSKFDKKVAEGPRVYPRLISIR